MLKDLRHALSILGILLAVGSWPTAQAAVQERTLPYQDGEQSLTAFFYVDDALTAPRPGVIVVHEWWGLNDYAKDRARRLAELGYAALAIDMYGDQRVTQHAAEAKGWMSQITSNAAAWQQRALAGLALLKAQPEVNPEQLAAIGYCFGGATVMQMAYAGADLDGVVSFHGALPPAAEDQLDKIHSKILIAHGEADSFVPPERIQTFKARLDQAGADWQMLVYGGAQHSFTNPAADQAGMPGLAYHALADQRSWRAMQDFLSELFAE